MTKRKDQGPPGHGVDCAFCAGLSYWTRSEVGGRESICRAPAGGGRVQRGGAYVAGPLKTFEAATVEQWRRWLADNHDSISEIWLVFYKKHTGRSSISHQDALDEALCFGWIDSLVRRLDDERFAIKFTPRKPDSKWSPTNRKRYAELAAAGRLAPPGLNRPPTDRSYVIPERREWKMPPYMRAELAKHPKALRNFERLAPSHRRRYVGWVDSAKRQETKLRRLREAIRLLAAGQPLGLK